MKGYLVTGYQLAKYRFIRHFNPGFPEGLEKHATCKNPRVIHPFADGSCLASFSNCSRYGIVHPVIISTTSNNQTLSLSFNGLGRVLDAGIGMPRANPNNRFRANRLTWSERDSYRVVIDVQSARRASIRGICLLLIVCGR